MKQIIGITLVRNEDLHIQWAIENILDFCDRIIVLDNYSTDRTWDILKNLAAEHSQIDLRRWWNAKNSQKVLREFYGTDTWIFAVDGDEIFDPIGLVKVRARILLGEFDSVYGLNGDYLNCTKIDYKNKTATGYFDATKPMGNLVNFSNVKGWVNEKRERLHGHPVFCNNMERKNIVFGTDDFSDPQLRCLHLCFMSRTSGVKKYFFSFIGWKRRRKELIKPNPSGNPYNARPGPGDTVEYKMKHYASGQVITRDITNFLGTTRLP